MKQDIAIWENQVKKGVRRISIPLMSHAGVELIGRTVSDAVRDGAVHFDALRELDKVYSPDAICSLMDLTVEAETFGCSINFSDHDIPTVKAGIVSDRTSVEKLGVPALYDHRTSAYLEAMRLAASHFIDKPVFAVCIGPFSLAGRLFGMTEIMTEMLFDPEMILSLVGKCTDFLRAYVLGFKNSGVNGIIMAEPAAGLLSAEQCDSFSSDFIRSVVREVQDNSFLFVLHNCGNTGHVTESMISTGARALHFGNRIELMEVLEQVPSDILVMGNIDPVGIFKMSDPDHVHKACNTLLQSTSKYNNYIVSSGCEIPPGVTGLNFASFFESLEKYNLKK